MDGFWQDAALWVEAHQGALSALVIAGVFAAPFVGLRAIVRHSRRRRVRSLYAELRKSNQIWGLRPDRQARRPAGASKDTRLVGPHDSLEIIALPFENLIPDPDQAQLGETFTSDLMALLHQRPNLRIAQVTYHRAAEATQGTALPLDHPYILEGVLERVDHNGTPMLRVTIQILETATGERVYSDRFDGPVSRSAALLDDVAEALAGTFVSVMSVPYPPIENNRPTSAPAAWALYRRGDEVLRIGMSRQRVDAAIRVLDHACRIDPGFAAAKYALARALALRVLLLTSRDEAADLARARVIIQAARQLLPDTPDRGVSEAMTALAAGDVRAALAEFDRAAKLDPSLSDLIIFRQLARLYGGQGGSSNGDLVSDDFEEAGDRALARLVTALKDVQSGAYDRAHARLEDAVDEASAFHLAWMLKALVLALMGRTDSARTTFARARRVIGSVDEARVREWVKRSAADEQRAKAWLAAFDGAWK